MLSYWQDLYRTYVNVNLRYMVTDSLASFLEITGHSSYLKAQQLQVPKLCVQASTQTDLSSREKRRSSTVDHADAFSFISLAAAGANYFAPAYDPDNKDAAGEVTVKREGASMS